MVPLFKTICAYDTRYKAPLFEALESVFIKSNSPPIVVTDPNSYRWHSERLFYTHKYIIQKTSIAVPLFSINILCPVNTTGTNSTPTIVLSIAILFKNVLYQKLIHVSNSMFKYNYLQYNSIYTYYIYIYIV